MKGFKPVEIMDTIKDLLKSREIATEGVGVEVPNAYCITYSDGSYRVLHCTGDSSVGFGTFENPEEALQTYVDLVTGDYPLSEEISAQFMEEMKYLEEYFLYYFMGYEPEMF